MSVLPTEKALNQALAEKLQYSADFLQWFLSRTRFAERNAIVVSCRADNPWGSHPFPVTDPLTGAVFENTRQSETDILLILRACDDQILAVHIENKLGLGKFTRDQPQMYRHRAQHWLGNPHYGAYTDFETVLLAPRTFIESHAEQTAHFGSCLSHEEIGHHIPDFAAGQVER